jgi:cyclopropane fatty-acyl-phospholipid synthase-like methyltransferase
MASDQFPKWDYKEYPKTLPPDDLWGQVRRTVCGKPVSEEQIQMMVDAVVAGLELHPASVLLDIGCGNAALSERLFPHCDQCLGVDFSEYLISVANARFASPRHTFICQDALEYVAQEADTLRFDRVLCFAVLSYLSDASARQLLVSLNQRFRNVRAIFVGNIPDRDCAASFFRDHHRDAPELDNPESQIGVWRTKGQMIAMAEQAGWRIRFQDMPRDFYQAHYRYNAILERAV